LKKKYTEQRLARSVVTQKLEKSSKDMTKLAKNLKEAEKGGSIKVSGLRRGLRSTAGSTARATRARSTTGLRSGSSRIQSTKRKPSAAAIMAKRKTRMATLTAASSRASRMLTRLTPRGTTSAAFVKKAKKMPLEGRSLRGRDISASSDEEEEEEEDEVGWANIRHIFNIRIMNIFDLLFEYSNIISSNILCYIL
jgi:hypothetical protein